MLWEFHTYSLISPKGMESLCYRPYAPALNEYIDERGYTDCYMNEDAVRSFVIRMYRNLGQSPPSLTPSDYITINTPIGMIYQKKIESYKPFRTKKAAIDFIRKNPNYDFDIQKTGYPPDISVTETSRDFLIYKDPITRRKIFIDNHFYKDVFGIIHRRKARRVTSQNIRDVKIFKKDSPYIDVVMCISKTCEQTIPVNEETIGIVRDKLIEISSEFSKITERELEDIIIRFGPYPPSKAVIQLRPKVGQKFNKSTVENLVEFIYGHLLPFVHMQVQDKLPDRVTGYFFEIVDIAHKMPLYTRGMIDVDEEGYSIFG